MLTGHRQSAGRLLLLALVVAAASEVRGYGEMLQTMLVSNQEEGVVTTKAEYGDMEEADASGMEETEDR